jgi:hypothetical protein
VLIGDARPRDRSYTARRTYFAEPADGADYVRAAQLLAAEEAANARLPRRTPRLKGDVRWMRAPNPIDPREGHGGGGCPACGSGGGARTGRLCGGCSARYRSGGVADSGAARGYTAPAAAAAAAQVDQFSQPPLDRRWRDSLRPGPSARDGPVSPSAHRQPRYSMLPSGRAAYRELEFDSAEERARIGFRDRGLRRWQPHAALASAAQSGWTSDEARPDGGSGGGSGGGGGGEHAAGGPGGGGMLDWAKWGAAAPRRCGRHVRGG